jgi:hypothetical protein
MLRVPSRMWRSPVFILTATIPAVAPFNWGQNMLDEALDGDLSKVAELLHKYGHDGQAKVVDEIRATLDSLTPDYQRLAGIEMWGGSGAVWDVNLAPWNTSTEARMDKRSFCQTIIRVAEHMDKLRIGTERCRFIAKAFQEWLDKGIM